MSDLDDLDGMVDTGYPDRTHKRRMTSKRAAAIKKGMASLTANRVKAASSLRVREAHSRAHRKHIPITLATVRT